MSESFDWSLLDNICKKHRIDELINRRTKQEKLSRIAVDLISSDARWHLLGTADGYTGNISEAKVQDRLVSAIGGETEVECLAGFADLVTSDSIVEIKVADQWKNGLGQVLSYNAWIQKPRMYLCLFNLNTNFNYYIVSSTCNRLNVSLLLYLRTGELIEHRIN